MGNSVATIEFEAFYECKRLADFVMPDSLIVIEENAFRGCSGLSIVSIPNSVTNIGKYAFYDCSNLTSVVIPESILQLGESVFENCIRLESILVEESNQRYKSIEGNLYTKDGKTLIQYAIGKMDTSFVVPEGVEVIGDWAFYNSFYLNTIEINGVVEIGNAAFYECVNFEK